MNPSNDIVTNLKRQRGLSLIEVLITVVIISVTLTTLIQGISQGIMMLESSEKLSTGARLAKKKMAELELVNFSIGAENSGDFEEEAGYSWSVEIKDPDLAEAKDFAISQVDLVVTWREGIEEKEILVSTYTARIMKLNE